MDRTKQRFSHLQPFIVLTSSMRSQNQETLSGWLQSVLIARCFSVKKRVFVKQLPFSGIFILIVVMVFAASSTWSTLIAILLKPTSLSNSLYILQTMKQVHTCASILLSVKWNMGYISNVPFEILKTRSTPIIRDIQR